MNQIGDLGVIVLRIKVEQSYISREKASRYHPEKQSTNHNLVLGEIHGRMEKNIGIQQKVCNETMPCVS